MKLKCGSGGQQDLGTRKEIIIDQFKGLNSKCLLCLRFKVKIKMVSIRTEDLFDDFSNDSFYDTDMDSLMCASLAADANDTKKGIEGLVTSNVKGEPYNGTASSANQLLKENAALRRELEEWKGKALYLEQDVKLLETSKRTLEKELGCAKNETLEMKKEYERLLQRCDKERNELLVRLQFEEEGRRAEAINIACFRQMRHNLPPSLSAERPATSSNKFISPPKERNTNILPPKTLTSPRHNQLGSVAATPTCASSFPSAHAIFGETFNSTPRCRRGTSVISSLTKSTKRKMPQPQDLQFCNLIEENDE